MFNTESIREVAQKIKVFLRFPPVDLLIVAIIILVGFSSFGLGRLSAQDTSRSPISVEIATLQTASVAEVPIRADISSGEVVASVNGSKYHFPWCSGAQRISDKNLIKFISIDEARKAGYTPAANCKGLE